MSEPSDKDLQEIVKSNMNIFSISCSHDGDLKIKIDPNSDPKKVAAYLRTMRRNLSELIATKLLQSLATGKIDQDFLMDFSEEWKVNMSEPLVRASEVVM